MSELQTYVLEKKAPNPKLRKKCTEDDLLEIRFCQDTEVAHKKQTFLKFK